MRAVITVVGTDRVGILAGVSAICSQSGMNVEDVTQSILQDIFAMVMIVETTEKSIPFAEFVDKMKAMGEETGLQIPVMHEDIFNAMHRI